MKLAIMISRFLEYISCHNHAQELSDMIFYATDMLHQNFEVLLLATNAIF